MTDYFVLTREDRDKLDKMLGWFYGADGINLTPDGLSVPQVRPVVAAALAGGARVTRLRFHSEENDYIICHSWDGTTEGTTAIYVAKPWKLRHDADNYEDVTSLSTTSASEVDVDDGGGGEDAETWIVTPSYQADDEIYAIRVPGTGVTVSSVELGLIDLNVDGRAWAKGGS